MSLNKQLTKYLKNYAEDEINALADFPKDINFNQAIVIPAYKESIAFIDRFFYSPLAQQKTLLILSTIRDNSISHDNV